MPNTDQTPIDDAYVIARLECAGTALLAMGRDQVGIGVRTSQIATVQAAAEAYGWNQVRVRPPRPSPRAIDEMDEAFAWLGLIPDAKTVLRRIVGARSLVNPVTGRHLFSWRKVGIAIGADHKAAQRWHRDGIDIIVAALARPENARHLRTMFAAEA